MDLISNVFYRVHFDVFPAQKDWNAFIEITKYIINWCKFKADRYKIELNWDWKKFRQYGTFEADGMRAISTRFRDQNTGISYWAAKVFEVTKSDTCADRTWISEFGIEQHVDGHITFSYAVMYEDRQGFLGELESKPDANVPSIINYLLTDKWVVCRSGQSVLSLAPTKILPGQMHQLRNALQDASRSCPIIYMTADKCGGHLLDAKDIAQLIAGNGLVFFSEYPDAYDEFNCELDEHFRCPEGGIRIYQPNVKLEDLDDQYRHVYFTKDKLLEMGKQKVYSILRRALCENIQNYTAKQLFRYEDCIELYDAYRRKKTQDLAAQAEENEFLFNDESRQLQEARAELDKIRYELQLTQTDYECEQRKNTALKASLAETAPLRERLESFQTSQMKLSHIGALPEFPEETVDMFLSIHFDKLDFTEKGRASLKTCQASASLLWQALFSMVTTLRDLYLSDASVNIVKEFQENSIFSLALTEGPETRKDKSLMSLRKDIYDGREISIEPHISYGNFRGDKSKSIRVYYAFDALCQKIIIGCCGEHLPNYSTKKFN